MNNNIIKMLLIACSLFSTYIGWAQLFVLPANDPHWNLVWHDEFNGDSINTSLWDFHAAWGNCSCSSSISPNQNNHNMHDGMVTLIAQQETDTCFMWEGGTTPNYYSKPYTSGCLYSQDTFKFGFFEIRSRFPAINYRKRPVQTGSGFSPCFWLYPTKYYYNPETNYSEIDVYEIGGRENRHTCNVHYSDSLHLTDMTDPENVIPGWSMRSNGDYSHDFIVNDGAFHVYSALWNARYVSIYYDNGLVRKAERHSSFNPGYFTPMNIVITNMANSQNFYQDSINANTILPYPYDIDYVRVYHLQCDDTTVVNDIPDFSTYFYGVKQSITLSHATTLPSNTSVYLRAKNFIKLQNGFEVPLGTTLYLITCSCEGDEQ